MAKNEEEVKNSVFGFGESNDAYAKYFVGKSYLKGLASSKDAKTGVSNVTFEPGCRNNWHGAAKDSWFAHIAIMVGEGTTKWYEPVSDEDYNKLG
ncbi:hypothetical protein [Lactobacillus kalixensis]|uniref:Uncharacterized protein n=1 Tax=Lactobacillus kalixensis DSM 16043 TaxID=1423763 RepID=A0A0R1UCF3_9LACO|nr:hypothetical protein [Lactobacillus kalixensis]KRL91084.1 hypothetical protein FC46_GL001380 [Lactobacillus kalixensis DSM 16043]